MNKFNKKIYNNDTFVSRHSPRGSLRRHSPRGSLRGSPRRHSLRGSLRGSPRRHSLRGSPRKSSPRRGSLRRHSPRGSLRRHSPRGSPRRHSPRGSPRRQSLRGSPRKRSPRRLSSRRDQYKSELKFLMDNEEKESLDSIKKTTENKLGSDIKKNILYSILGYDQLIACYRDNDNNPDIYDFEVPNDLTQYVRIEVYKKFYISENTIFSDYLENIIVHNRGKVILNGDMTQKFYDCQDFNSDVSKWDVSNVTNMEEMFYNCSMFEGRGLENWDVSNVENMSYMFTGCSFFNANLSFWGDKLGKGTDKVKNMENMFSYCDKFEGKGLETWDVSKVENMSYMFIDCILFNADLSLWGNKLSTVKTMRGMFYNCSMFEGKGLENWDVRKVENISSMFFNCKVFEGRCLENWNVSKVENMRYMFCNCVMFNADLSFWGNKLGKVENMGSMFLGCESFEGRGLEKWYVSNVTNMSEMFEDCVMFNTDLSFWGNKLGKVENMELMFSGCIRFQGKGLEKWNVSNVTNMSNVFSECSVLNSNLSSWIIPPNTDLGLRGNYPTNLRPRTRSS